MAALEILYVLGGKAGTDMLATRIEVDIPDLPAPHQPIDCLPANT